ncbi:carboxypeptidase-like regulatory domain-containing protein [Candidatus Poribacteria bacterium]|nr:carboxypeptidase-like regulatory domain-containing protein [Candidatus Poribacteria bacterium]
MNYVIYFFAILFTYSFPVIAQEISTGVGEIHGTVYQRGSGGRLASANVRLIETDQHLMTDANGEFRFSALPPGKYTLTAIASGYRLSESSIVTIKSGETTQVKIYLERIEFLFEEIPVTAQRLPATVSRQTLQGLEIKRIPGTGGDALRALQALPGIGVANSVR